MDTFNIGRFAIPIAPLLLLGAMTVGTTVAKWHGRRGACNVEPLLLAVLATGLAVGRAAFILEYLPQYLEQPWRMLDIRDQGFSRGAAILAAIAMTGWLLWRRTQARKPMLYSTAATACFWGMGVLAASAMDGDARYAPMPDLVLPGLDGNSMSISALKGKPVVINLWATWCPPCRRELPVLRDAQMQCPDVAFVLVDQGESASQVRAYLASQGLALNNVLLDSAFAMSRQANAKAFPTTLFLDEQGRLIDRHTGELSPATLARHLENLAACTAQKSAARARSEF
ncbi:TlpA family protein disulfide reductase [Noviherbaspirillum pedocola]|uniref:TlpA family protein disulfide reductase n=1 Tax=Noviherbaspirillum pedocola TaxID=2801341 RepID=A0A934W5H6_9BURK|nr:TlpA disulfide reductase family protein [Noviherbaspirillum pedocola]MBK4734967.1 TlpA family protein disulfide reductase [Noviherbaspirillum pedocola]